MSMTYYKVDKQMFLDYTEHIDQGMEELAESFMNITKTYLRKFNKEGVIDGLNLSSEIKLFKDKIKTACSPSYIPVFKRLEDRVVFMDRQFKNYDEFVEYCKQEVTNGYIFVDENDQIICPWLDCEKTIRELGVFTR